MQGTFTPKSFQGTTLGNSASQALRAMPGAQAERPAGKPAGALSLATLSASARAQSKASVTAPVLAELTVFAYLASTPRA